MTSPWVNDSNAALLTDLYELTMLQSYFDEGMNDIAVFDLFIRRLPDNRNYFVACGLEHALHYLETFSFLAEAVESLRSVDRFSEAFLNSLRGLRFKGDAYAVPEGTLIFPNEPILEIVAPLPQAQIVETFLMTVHTVQRIRLAVQQESPLRIHGIISQAERLLDRSCWASYDHRYDSFARTPTLSRWQRVSRKSGAGCDPQRRCGRRARLSSARPSRNQMARSVWSAWSLLPLSNRATHPTAGASSTHSIRFARHDRPCHPSVQFAPYPPKICAKKQDFRLYYSARRGRARSPDFCRIARPSGALRTGPPYHSENCCI